MAFAATLLALHALSPRAGAQESPNDSRIEVAVGDSTVTISHPKPAARGRTIWGGLLPFGKPWTGGVPGNTTLVFEEDVKINSIRLATGRYEFYVHPVNDRDWQLVFGTDGEDVLRVAVRPVDAPHQENLAIGIENIEEEDGSHHGDFYVHWGDKKAALRLRMTGERRGMGLDPEIPDDAAAAWAVVQASVDGLITEQFVKHVRKFTEDFETDFGDGGNTDAHLQLLNNLSNGGLTEGMALNLENLEFELDGDKATFKRIVVYSTLGTITLRYLLEKRNDNWKITYLSTD